MEAYIRQYYIDFLKKATINELKAYSNTDLLILLSGAGATNLSSKTKNNKSLMIEYIVETYHKDKTPDKRKIG